MAPVSMISNIKSGTQITFGAGRAVGCMRMRVQYRAAQVVVASSGAAAPYTSKISFTVGPTVTNRSFILPLLPANSYYFPTYVYTMARLFSSFYVNKAVVHFEPRQSSSSTYTFVVASVQDPEWFETHSLLTGGTATPTENTLVSRSNACTSNGWTPCTVNIPVDSKVKYFLAGSSVSTGIDFSTENPASIRQSIPAIFTIASDVSVVSVPDIVIGDLYASFDFEFCDFSTAFTSPVALSEKRRWGEENKLNEKKSSSVKSLSRRSFRGDSEDDDFK
jgi:hypothetical protein